MKNISKQENLTNALVFIFWAMLLISTSTGLLVLVIAALPFKARFLIVCLAIVVTIVYAQMKLTKSNNRMVRVTGLTLAFSITPILFSSFSLVGLMNATSVPLREPNMFHQASYFFLMTVPYIYVLWKVNNFRIKDRLYVDSKVAMQFVTAILTIIYSLQSYFTHITLVKEFLISLLIPFSINVLLMAAFSYIDTNSIETNEQTQ